MIITPIVASLGAYLLLKGGLSFTTLVLDELNKK